MGFRLLYPSDECEICSGSRAYIQDLNLDQIINKVCDGYDEEVMALYWDLPKDRKTQEYRRGIFSELKKKELLPALMDFLGNMKERNACLEKVERVENPLQKQVWFLREGFFYVKALENLRETLSKKEPCSEGLKGLLEFLDGCIWEERFHAMAGEAKALFQELAGFRLHLTYEKERFLVSEEQDTGKAESGTLTGESQKGESQKDYGTYLRECFPDNVQSLKSPFLSDVELSELEMEILRIFQKDHKLFFEKVEVFWKKFQKYAREDVLSLQKEAAFYTAYLRFQEKMSGMGFSFCTPQSSRDSIEALGLYDLALAVASLEDGRQVVCNDVKLGGEERFFVLTGPNQGGKTTFARSLGQLAYFSKMGLDVPARSARVMHFEGLLTHFSVEESMESGRGKLMDELERLKPMMEPGQRGAFIVINELFTTAANYDACIMGKRVLETFLEHDCRGIYVTHIGELAKADERVVSLRAQVDGQKRPTYEIERNGQDMTDALAGASRQVEKYHLTYQQIKERFS